MELHASSIFSAALDIRLRQGNCGPSIRLCAAPVEGAQRTPAFDLFDIEIYPKTRLLIDGQQSCSATMHANLPQPQPMQPSVQPQQLQQQSD
jgi:hypothetical protein